MRDEAPHNLDELAAAVADGRRLNWDELESRAESDAQRDAVRRLRAIAAIGLAHAELTFSDSTSDSLSVRSQLPGVDDPSVPTQWGSLRILERVGRGRFGDVYRAWDPGLDREVALKLLRRRDDSTAGDREVIEEGRLMARVRHPNVVAVYGAQRIDGRTGLWMEFVEGGRTLASELTDRGPFPPADIIDVGVQLCRALAAVHDAGLVHRDVKAQNVLRDQRGRILLGDFGTGRELLEATGPNDLVGTPAYLAPELLRGEPATRQSDVYSLGVLLFRLATGTLPVRGSSIREIRAAHDRRDHVSIAAARSDVPASVISAIERALDPDQSCRFSNAGELQAALESSVTARPSPRAPNGVLAVGIAAVIVALAAGVALWQRKLSPASEISRVGPAATSKVRPPSAEATAAAVVTAVPANEPALISENLPAPPSTVPPAASQSRSETATSMALVGIISPVPPELSPGSPMQMAATIEDHLRVGDTAAARRNVAAVPAPANPNDFGGLRWRLMFDARASWQELKAQDALNAVDAIVSTGGGSAGEAMYVLPVYLALGRLKQAEQIVAELPPTNEQRSVPAPFDREVMLGMVLQHSADRIRLHDFVTQPNSKIRMNYRWLINVGRLGEARNVLKAMSSSGVKQTLDAQIAEAEITLLLGEPARAIEMLKDAVPTQTSRTFPYNLTNASLSRVRALAWEALGEPARGIEALKEFDVERHVILSTLVGVWLEQRALLARLNRAAGRESEARALEEELRKLLAVADDDHPVLVQLRTQTSR